MQLWIVRCDLYKLNLMFYTLLSYMEQHKNNLLLVDIEEFNDNWTNIHQIINREFNVYVLKIQGLNYKSYN